MRVVSRVGGAVGMTIKVKIILQIQQEGIEAEQDSQVKSEN